MKINIINTVVLNGGDAAILFAEMKLLRESFGPDTTFSVYDSQPQDSKKYYKDVDFKEDVYFDLINPKIQVRKVRGLVIRLRKMFFLLGVFCYGKGMYGLARIFIRSKYYKWLVQYAEADMVVSTGGTYLVEHYNLEGRIFEFELALLLGKPLVFFTQSLGPFRKRGQVQVLRKIFNSSLCILVRDERSRENLRAIGVDLKKVIIHPDVVYSLPLERISMKTSKDIKIAISVRNWKGFQEKTNELGMADYKKAISSIIIFLIKNYDASIDFISTCQGTPEYWTDDSQVAKDIYEILPEDAKQHVTIDRSFHDPISLRNIFRKYTFVISTRMHVAILAMTAGVPVMPIVYEFKTEELFKILELEKIILNIETINTSLAIEKTQLMFDDMENICSVMSKNVAYLHKHALKSGAIVRREYETAFAKRQC